MTRITISKWSRVAATLMLASFLATAAYAQQAGRAPPASKGGAAPVREAAPSSDPTSRRIEQIEEQLVDMQVVIGTLESLARGTAAPAAGARAGAPSAAISAADAGRMDSIETQIRALAAQIESMQEQLRAMGGRGAEMAPGPQVSSQPGPIQRPGRGQAEAPVPERTGFGSVVVSPDNPPKDEIDRILTSPDGGRNPQVAAAPPPGSAGEADANPKQLYETAYGYLLQRDYGAAETAFDEFLRRHPNDPLAGNAQYWLGESLYVRGQYRAAAGAFLKGYQTYNRSAKAPESLLKLAMSLQRLGQKDAACSSFNELTTKFPSAPAHVKNAAQNERQRAGC
jgi:tol-pal system protein YbgF